MNSYLVGQTVVLSTTVRNVLNQLVNPTTVTCTVKRPDGTTTNVILDNPTVGNYEGNLTVTQNGMHYYRFEADEPDGAIEGRFRGVGSLVV